ncbi:MAG: hypothetical protein WC205_14150 [Opitutaceae bacterium]|jgi:hypothetical protein
MKPTIRLSFVLGALSVAAVCCAAPAPLSVVSYEYPPQDGLAHVQKTDLGHLLLTDGIQGGDGPSAVWGEWGKKSLSVDWRFHERMKISEVEIVLVHPRADSDASHVGSVHFYAADLEDTRFSGLPVYSADVPFEEGRHQVVRLKLPAPGMVAGRLRTVFEAKRYQSVVSEVVFFGERAGAGERVTSTVMKAESAANGAVRATGSGPTYDYPPQGGLDHIVKSDTQRSLLTDGKAGAAGNMAAWGKWGVNEMLIDWRFETPVRVKAIQVTIVHPQPGSDASHASEVRIHGMTEPGTFLAEPDFVRDIPFEPGSLQEVRLVIPAGGIVADRLRTVFVAGRHQVALSEVRFETEPVSAAEAAAAQKARAEAQPERFSTVTWLQRTLPADARVSGDSIFGVCGHFLHTNAFYGGNNPRFNDHWRPSRTMPWVVEGNFNWVRETLYLSMFRIDGENTEKGRANRKRVEDYLQRYQDRGVKVLLGPMFGGGQGPGFLETADWIGELARRFPAVKAVELHNEPNLRGFWKGTPQEFVDAARVFTSRVKAVAPHVTIVAGSFSGWGGAWQHENLRELLPGPREIATRYAEEVFKLGLLEFADAVSAHPYRGRSAPEGGEVIESPTDPDGFAKEIRGWLELVARYTPGGKRLPLYLTEIGYSVSHQGYTTVPTEVRQADYITRLFLVLLGARLDGIPLEGVFWYDLKQDEIADSHYESNFGIVAPNASRPRPAWLAARRVMEFFANNADFRALPVGVGVAQFSNGPELIKSYAWERVNDGALIIPFWRMNQLQKRDIDFDSELALTLPDGFRVRDATLHDLHEDRARSTGFKLESGVLSAPLHVTSRAAWLVISRED